MDEIKKMDKEEILKILEKEGKKKEKEFTKKDMEIITSKKEGLIIYFSKIINILKEFMDMDEECYSLVALWIIGTYFHKQFPSYPYLFFNAMKGSGKTRILKIISTLSKNGKLVGSMTEAVLFRTAAQRTLCIDEVERMNVKGQENLRLLLNSAYKKGLSVERLVKRKVDGQEEQVVQEFEVYCPIAMANIWGLENVLQDRCIPVILEKSSKNQIIKLIENFENDMKFKTAKGGLLRLTEKLQNTHEEFFKSGIFDSVFDKWNYYQKNVVSKVNIVNKVSVVNNVRIIDNNVVNKKKKKKVEKSNLKGESYDTYDTYDIRDVLPLFKNINKTDLSGRDLELFFPLFILADMISPEILNELLETAKKVVKYRKESDRDENKDVRLLEFLAQSDYKDYCDTATIVKDFQEYVGEEEKWINSRGISRALTRLKLILDRATTGKRRQIKINIPKAQEKLLMFKDPEEIKGLKQFSDAEIKEAGWTREKLQKTLKEPEKPKKEKTK